MKPIEKESIVNIFNLGICTNHNIDHIHSIPKGFKHYLITCFQTPFICQTKNGKEIGHPGDCLIFEPGFPQWHTCAPDAKTGFINDWIYVSSEEMPELIKKFELPVNVIIQCGNPRLLTKELTEIRNEVNNNFPFRHIAIGNRIESILLKIHRGMVNKKIMASYSPSELEYYSNFVDLREQISNSATEKWDVDKMASIMHLSRNRFSVLYRKFFQNSPIDDLLIARIDFSKYHLLISNSTIEEIAEKCGFSNVYYFSKLFKKRVGIPPGKYRQSLIK